MPAEKAVAPEVRPLSEGEAHYRVGQLMLASLPLSTHCSIGLAQLHLARKQPALALAPLEHAERWARTDEQRAAVRALIDEARRD